MPATARAVTVDRNAGGDALVSANERPRSFRKRKPGTASLATYTSSQPSLS